MTQTTGDIKANWEGNIAGCYSVLELIVKLKPISPSAPKGT